MPSKKERQIETMRKLQRRASARQNPADREPVTTERQDFRGSEAIYAEDNCILFRGLTHMTKPESRSIVSRLAAGISAVPMHAASRLHIPLFDVVFMILCFCTGNLCFGQMYQIFHVSETLMSRMIQEYVPVLARVAKRLWMPDSVTSEASRCWFGSFPNCVAAIDTTPIRVLDSRNLFRSAALWSQKYGVCCWKLLCAVAPNCICVWFASLAPGRHNDKRFFDESNAADVF